MLNTAYLALAILGCGYVLLSAFLGHLTDAGDGGAHDATGHATESHYGIDGSGHGAASGGMEAATAFHFPFFSPLALATFLGALGAFGLIARFGLGVGEGTSVAIAMPAALATAYGASYLGWRLFAGAVGSSAITVDDMVGAPGEVITPIPAGGLGEVAAMVHGQRFTASAREAEGREVPRGAGVTVVRMMGSTLVVQRASQER